MHEDVIARALEAKGIASDRCELNRQIKVDNALLREIKAQVKKLLGAVKNTIPALAEAMESVREKMIIFKYQLGHILTGKRRLTKSLDAMKPEVERYTRIIGQIKEKSKERNTLLTEKKATPMLNIIKHRNLSRRIAELTEELEELRFEKKQLLAMLDYAEDTGLSTVKKDVSAMEANLAKQKQQEQKYTAELNYWGGYLFYLTEEALVRMNLKNGQEEGVSDSLRGHFCIYNGTLFLDDEKGSGYLYGIDTDSLEIRQLNAETRLDCLNAEDGSLFYADPKNGSCLFSCDYDGGNLKRLLSRPCAGVTLCGGRIYCLTTGENSNGDTNILVSMDPEGSDLDVLTDQPVTRFIAGENGIFYISAPSGYLEWMTPDGKTRYTVCAEAVADFNLAGRWIFYRIAGDDALYRMRIDGSDSVKLP